MCVAFNYELARHRGSGGLFSPPEKSSPPASVFANAPPSPHRLQEAVIIHPPLVGFVAEHGDPAVAKEG